MPCSEKTSAFICRCAALFLSLTKIMQGERNGKTGKLCFSRLDTAEPQLIFVKDKRRLVICDHPFPCDVFLSKHVAAWRMMRQQLIT